MKKLLVTLSSVVVVVALFTVVAYGSDLLNFNGDGQLDQSAADVEEILNILEQVHTDKMSTEEALEKLEKMDPHGLLAENNQLKEDIKGFESDISNLNGTVEGLENDIAELNRQNENRKNTIAQLNTDIASKNTKINQKNNEINRKQDTINDKNAIISQKDAEIERKQTEIDGKQINIENLTTQKSELESQLAEEESKNSVNSEQIAHLEKELQRANTKVAEHSTTTENAVKQARTYVNSAE